MRKFLVCFAVAGLSACSSTPTVQSVQSVQPVASMSSVPDWFTEVPKNDDYLYAVGDGVSGSVSGAIGNARANAFEGICQGAGGTVRSQTKVFRQDTETHSSSITTTAIRNLCADVSVAGATVDKSKIIVENGRYHAFVMVALPLGDKNKVTKAQRERANVAEVKTNAEKEFRELDNLTGKSTSGPVSQAPHSDGSITLMNVDNAEYKAKRDIALQKEGAVIGQSTVR